MDITTRTLLSTHLDAVGPKGLNYAANLNFWCYLRCGIRSHQSLGLSHNKHAAGRVATYPFGGGAQEPGPHLRKPGMAYQDQIEPTLLRHLDDGLGGVADANFGF